MFNIIPGPRMKANLHEFVRLVLAQKVKNPESNPANKAPHWPAIPLRSMAGSEL